MDNISNKIKQKEKYIQINKQNKTKGKIYTNKQTK
jgi:hypothetical protein